MVYLFCSDLLLFPRKFAKSVQDADHYKNCGHKCRKYLHKNYARENCKSKVAFLQFVYLSAKYWQLFTPKPGILRLIMNSRRVFKNQLYFMVTKYNFVAFFQDALSLCGLSQNHLRLRL